MSEFKLSSYLYIRVSLVRGMSFAEWRKSLIYILKVSTRVYLQTYILYMNESKHEKVEIAS